MKKNILRFTPIILLILIIVFYTFIPSVYKTWFIIRHLFVYMFLSYILIYASILSYNRLVKRYKINLLNKNILKVFVSAATVALLLLLSRVQLEYIQDYEIPPLRGCAYYDQYNNLIYSSQFDFSCPDLDNVTHTVVNGKEVLHFTVSELAEGNTIEFIRYDDDSFSTKKFYKKSAMENQFEYVYYKKGVIEKVTITSRTEHYKDGDELYHYNGSKRIVENKFSKGQVTSIQTRYSYDNEIEQGDVINIPNFEDLTPEIITYTSALSVDGNEYLIDLTEIIETDSQKVVNVFAKGNVELSKSGESKRHHIAIYGYENERYNEHSADYTFLYNQLRVKREAPRFNNKDREGTFVYSRVSSGLRLSNYTRMVDNHEVGLDVKVKHYNVNGDTYSINHLSTSKIMNADVGKKVEYYYTYRNPDNKYASIRNNGNSYSNFLLSLKLDEMYDYKYMLFDYTKSERLDFYQFNPLIEGFEEMHDELGK